MTNLNELLKKLLKEKIEFVIVGGFAGVLHGATQVTQDLDICLMMKAEQVAQLRNALADINPVHRMNPNNKLSFIDHPEDIKGFTNLYLDTDIGILDVMSEIPNIGDFNRVNQGAVEIDIFGFKCKVMGLDDLIEVKKNLKRAKDQALYRELLEIKKVR